MKLPSYRRLFKQDFDQKDQALVDKLSITINSSFESLFDALNKGVTFQDNFVGGVVDVQVTTSSNPAYGYYVTATPVAGGSASTILVNGAYSFTQTPSYPIDSSVKTVDGVFVLKVDNLTSPTKYPIGGVTVSFSKNGNNIILNNVTGLDKSTTYNLKILTVGH